MHGRQQAAKLRPAAALASQAMVTRWTDLVDPTHEELQAALPADVDPDVRRHVLASTADES